MDNPDATAEPAEEPGADPPDTEHRLKRIETLTQTARATWFGYLGAVVFAGITLLGVEDKDFFSFDSSTQLPLVNVSVPVTSFFWAGGGLMAILYGYLHVFLEKLWRELGAIPARHRGLPISESVHPWIVSDYALRRRRRLRPAEQATETEPVIWTPLGVVGALASFLLCWLSGPAIAAAFWYRSMPAHEWPMTVFLGVLLAATVATCLASLATLNSHVGLRLVEPPPKRRSPLHPANLAWAWWRAVTLYSDERLARQRRHIGRYRDFALFAVLALLLTPVSVMRTEWDWLGFRRGAETVEEWKAREWAHERSYDLISMVLEWFRPVPARLAEANLTELPSDWLTRNSAHDEFYLDWCARRNQPDKLCEEVPSRDPESGFVREWEQRRGTYLRALDKPNLRARNLSRANLTGAHLPGIDLREARLEGASLIWAQLEGARLRNAQLEGAFLIEAQLEGAFLIEAHLEGADLFGARLEGADLNGAHLEEADLNFVGLEGALLYGARLEGARLLGARLEGADLNGAHLEGADLREARLDGADLTGAHLEGADLSFSFLLGATDQPMTLSSANLSASINHGGALRFVDLREAIVDERTDFRNTFGDNTVRLPLKMVRPCQWGPEDEDITDAQFFGRWRGWIELGADFERWSDLAPPGFEDVPPIPPPAGCVWKTDPIPAAD